MMREKHPDDWQEWNPLEEEESSRYIYFQALCTRPDGAADSRDY